MGGSLRLGKLFGIPFFINYTWFVIFALITVSLAYDQFPRSYPFWSPVSYWVVGGATSLLFFASVVAHELAHGAVARSMGIPVRGITLFIFGGVAQIGREASRPRGELAMAIVGPLSSLGLALLFSGLSWVAEPWNPPLAALAGWLARINLMLALFNLVPGFPLDGGRVLRAILWAVTGDYRRATRVAALIGQGVAYGLILGGVVWAVAFPQHLLNGLWLVLTGWFLDRAAEGAYRQAIMRETLLGYTAADLMNRDCPSIPPTLTLRDLVHRYIMSQGFRFFLVIESQGLQGVLTMSEVGRVPQERWDSVSVGDVMIDLERVVKVSPQEGAATVLDRMEEMDIGQVPVVEDGQVLGTVRRDRLLSFIRTRAELRL